MRLQLNGFRAGTLIAFAALIVCFALPIKASAQNCDEVNVDPTAAQYCPPVPPDDSDGGGGSAGGNSVDAGGTLPFTGLDLAALFSVAVGMTAAGLTLRKLSAREGPG